jgi:putative ABC transport system permease protein
LRHPAGIDVPPNIDAGEMARDAALLAASLLLHNSAVPNLPANSRPSWLPSGTSLLAWRNLAHDRSRFIVTLIGIVFAVVLMGAQLGLLVGFAQTASGLIDHADADLWVVPIGTTNVDIASRLPGRRKYEAMTVPGVASVNEYMVQFAFWRKPNGGNESVILAGFEPSAARGAPWRLVEGSLDDLQTEGTVIMDRLYREKLGVHALGQIVEINSQRARVVGFTEGIRTFTQSPYIFTTHTNAQHFARFPQTQTTYLLIGLEAKADPDTVKAALKQRLGPVDVHTRQEFSRQTQSYWLITTGAGSALLLAACLGLVVGIVIVGQTLYASTVDRLPEYATLRAMGAPNGYLYRVILKQAAISAVFGFAAGLSATLLMVWISNRGNIAMSMPPWMILMLGALTALMCALGAVASIRRVMRIDPTSVFQ